MEYRLRRHDGEYRWVLDTGVPRFTPGGSFAGYIGTAIDVTTLKLAEKALSGLSRKLMNAHEEERTRIAREIHDDVGQRMALLTIELERLGQEVACNAADVRGRVLALSARAADLGKDLHGIPSSAFRSSMPSESPRQPPGSARKSGRSRSWRSTSSSKAVRRTCRRKWRSVSSVLQEAVSNAAKHAGVRQFTVVLRASGAEVQLSRRRRGRVRS
jgi:signal transduction histidine kinase